MCNVHDPYHITVSYDSYYIQTVSDVASNIVRGHIWATYAVPLLMAFLQTASQSTGKY